MKIKLATLMCLVLFSSCKKSMQIAMGVKQPRVENNKSIIAFLNRAEIKSENVYYVDSVSSYDFWMDSTRFDRIPGIEVYNGKGELIQKMAHEECSGTFGNLMADTKFHELKPIVIDAKNINDVMKPYRRIDGKLWNISDVKNDEIVVCMSYVNAMGKISLNYLGDWTKDLKQNPDFSKVKIFYLNMDMHESWGIRSRKDSRRLKFDY